MRTKINFTKAALLSIKAPASGQRLVLQDTKILGLQCRITDKGVATFSVYRRIKGGQPVRVTIGKLCDISVEQARTAATLINAAIARGENPAQARRAHKESPTFSELYEAYREEYAKRVKKSWKQDEGRYHQYLEKPLGNKKVCQITKAEIMAIHARISKQTRTEKEVQAAPRYKTAAANRVLTMTAAIFTWGIAVGKCDENPAKGIRKNREKSRDRFLQPEELTRFFEAVKQESDKTVQDFILLLLYTGARRGNVLAMGWDQISFQQKTWHIPETKNGEPVILPLTEEAINILQARMNNGSDYVFPGRGKSGHMSVPKDKWRNILKRAEIKDLRLHDLRRTLGSWQAITGSSMLIIGKSLGHKSPKATAIYARLNLDPVRKSVEVATQAMLSMVGVTQAERQASV